MSARSWPYFAMIGRSGSAHEPAWVADGPPPSGEPPWTTSRPQRSEPPWVTDGSQHGEPPPVTDGPQRSEPPWVTDGPQRSEPPWVTEGPPAGEPPWGASAPPAARDVFTSAPGDAGTNTGSLPAITGGLIRRQGTFTGRVTRDGSSGFAAEPARYQLYASLACPWSQRALIVCRLLGLDRVIGLTLTEPIADERGWRFSNDGYDPLTGASLLAELYRASDVRYVGPCTVPLLWDLRTRRIVSNDVAQITVMLETEFRAFHRSGAPDLYPAARRREIESLATLVYHTVNTGVYKAGLATTQASYDQAVEAVFTTLDALDERLARRRFLLGDLLTEADIRLYPTLARFDAVYYQLFNCNLRRLTDYRHLWAYTRDLYSHPGFGETTDLGQIKQHYYRSAGWGGKWGIVPIGPQISWNEPHGRARMPS